MKDVLTSPAISDFLTNMATGDLNLVTGLLWLVLATAMSMIGGAIGGMILAGKDIGYAFSAMLGALFAPAGAIPAILLGLAVLTLLQNY
ncbi:hypothetical protein [Halotia branconii]|uniref:Uncharacterized protein n=1 Tax=Halotia branconii CENA392 TaxID=1539056 RepID=A0AAJ6NS52_9CYAN|nr:hypothetical protein [Halotia branconii]WGV25398.1 hypothetical protein QI031_27265 [Halotia branconii CENA392]